MPIYEYRCRRCGKEYEAFQRITDDSYPPCEACQSMDVQRLVSMSSFHLKGSGWYATDYKGKNAGNGAPKNEPNDSKPAESTASDTPSSGGSSGESKSAPAASSPAS